MADLLKDDDEPTGNSRRRSSRKRDEKSYVECPDIVIEEDFLSKPSPAKKANLSSGTNDIPPKKTRGGGGANHGGGGLGGGGLGPGGKEVLMGTVTNGIEMESDEEESEDTFPPVPAPQVHTTNISRPLASN